MGGECGCLSGVCERGRAGDRALVLARGGFPSNGAGLPARPPMRFGTAGDHRGRNDGADGRGGRGGRGRRGKHVERRILFHGCSQRSEEHTSELQSLMRISYAVYCLKKKNKSKDQPYTSLISTTQY